MNNLNEQIAGDILQWDIRSWKICLDFWEEKMQNVAGKKALELGGREGGLTLWLALKGCEVVCSDITDAKKSAEKLHNKYPTGFKITYKDIDACAIPYTEYFDIIIFKSIIGGIGRGGKGNQQKVFSEIHRALKPGGQLLFAENLVASPVHRWLRKKFIRWGNEWRYVTIDEMKSFLSVFRVYEIKTSGVLATFGRNEKQRSILCLAGPGADEQDMSRQMEVYHLWHR